MSINGSISKIFLGVVILINNRFQKIHIFPLGQIEILELPLSLPHPNLMPLVVVQPLVDPS